MSSTDVRKAAEKAAREAVAADRERSAGIRTIAARFGFPRLGESHASKGTSIRAFKDIVLERLAKRQEQTGKTTFAAARGADNVHAERSTEQAGETKQAREFENGAAEARALLGKKA